MRFEKWHALGNAYLLVQRQDDERLDPARVRRLCDRNTGVGSDGILEITARSPTAAEVVIWNPDGSVAEMSGNGTRIVAAWLLEDTSGAVEVTTGDRVVGARAIGHAGAGTTVEQDVDDVVVGADLELDIGGERISVIPVTVGNPHAVVRRATLARDDLLRLGPLLERHEQFPARTNVQLVVPRDEDTIDVLVWERGAGETTSSGSSAVAVAAAATERGWCAGEVRVSMPGGELRVSVDGHRALLVGPAERICTGETTL